MSGHQHRRLPWLAAAVTLAFLAVGTSPAAAHTHPTPIERASPGVVFIEARAKVEVALIEHRQAGDNFGVHIGIIQSTWNPVLDTASGFVVDPTGAIVTTGSITRPDLDRARIFAVNQAFHQRYGDAAPLPKDPFSRNRLGDSGDRNEQRLEACYPPNVTNDAGGCVVRVTPDYVVYPYVTSQQRYGGLHAEVLPGGTRDVAVLSVRGANSMPTVAVGSSTAGAEALGVLGFTGITGADNPLQEINQHLATKGGDRLKTTGLDAGDVRDAARLHAGLQNGMAGGPVLAERGQVVGLLPSARRPGSAAPRLVSIASVLPVLAKAGITPHGGPVDASFEAAMHLFKNNGYAASIPSFTKALELFPGHFLASRNLAIAKQRSGAGVRRTGTGAGATVAGGSTRGPGALPVPRARGRAGGGRSASFSLSRCWPRGRCCTSSGGGDVSPVGRGGRARAVPLRGPPAATRPRARTGRRIAAGPEDPAGAGGGGTGGPPRPAGAALEAAARRCGGGLRPVRHGVRHAPAHQTDAARPYRPAGRRGRPGRPDGSRAPGGAAPVRPGAGPAPRPNASSAASSVAAPRPAGADRQGQPVAPAAAGSAPASASAPAAAPHPATRCRHRGRPRSRPRGSAPPAAAASRHGTSSVGGAVNLSADSRTRRCP